MAVSPTRLGALRHRTKEFSDNRCGNLIKMMQ
jgi:hypothetical protein